MYFRSVTSFAALAVLLSLTTFGCSNGRTVAQSSDTPTPTPTPPQAQFTTTVVSGDAPLDVQFTNQSDLGGEIFPTYTWIFGDGPASNEKSPLHTYQLPGVYSVTLVVVTTEGTALETKTDLVTVLPSGSPPQPDFSADPTSDGVPLDVQFTDNSILDPEHSFVVYAWDFGDGHTSSEQHPLHRYTKVGVYAVSLTISTAGGTIIETKTSFIEALFFVPPPVADFSATPQIGKPPLLVQFTNLSSLNGAESATYLWNFGDGQSSTDEHPLHAFSTIGLFTVSLTTTTRGGENTKTKTGFINTSLLPPVADFTGNPTMVPPNVPVVFTDLSDLDGALNPSFVWDFGDGAFSAVRNPSHAYAAEGFYTVSLRVTTLAGTDTEIKINFIDVRFPAPIADFSATPVSGKPPLIVQFTNLSKVFGAGGVSYLWTFGDGQSSSEENPNHTYLNAGIFTVSLRVTTTAGSDLETKTDFIRVLLGDRNFVVTFIEAFTPTATLKLTLFISSEFATNGLINIPGLGTSQPFSLSPGVIGEFDIDVAAMVLGSDTFSQRGIEIFASDPISVYGLNHQGGTADGFVAAPEDALGTEHYVMTIKSNSPTNPVDLQKSQFAIVAKEDNTSVTITLTEDTDGMFAGVPYTIILDRLEVYQLQSDDNGEDLTGTRIISSLPVAVFSGHTCAHVPDPSIGGCDYLTEQTPPVFTWGTHYITVPLAGRDFGDTVRIMAQLDNTTVTIEKQGPSPSTESFFLDSGRVVQRILDDITLITADGPIQVSQFANGASFDGPTAQVGDPFMMTIVPSERFLTTYTFPTPENTEFQNHFVSIVADTADAVNGLVLLDSIPIDPSAFTLISSDPTFSAASMPVTAGATVTTHTIAAPNPVGLYIYGFSNAQSSYGFPGGMAF